MMAWGKNRDALERAYERAIQKEFEGFTANWIEASSPGAVISKEQAKANLARGMRLITEAYEIVSKLPG